MITKRSIHRATAEGFALPAVLILGAVAAIIGATVLLRAEKGAARTGDLLARRQAFYAVDGMSRIVIREVQNYMMQNPDPTTEDLQNPDNVPPPAVDGFDVETFEIESTGDAYEGPIPSGSYEGLYSRQKPIRIRIVGRETGGIAKGEVNLRVTLGQISMFQFLWFGDGYTDVFPGPSMTVNPGRIHSNGDLCLGSNSTFQIERITAAGRVLASDPRCRRYAGSGAWIWDGESYQKIDASTSNDCTNCAGSGMKWHAYALSTWKGNVKDSSHGVTPLRLPITSSPNVQGGLDAAGGPISNADKMRVLIDPVLPTDGSDVLEQKFAWNADIRIINGVWYINDGTWPGRAVWSDHPGQFTTTNEEGIEGSTPMSVGQDDLASALGWPSIPRRFSYYEYDPLQERLADDTNGIISYGSLYRNSSSSRHPGYWLSGPWQNSGSNRSYTDVDGHTKDKFCATCNGGNCTSSENIRNASQAYCQSNVNGHLEYRIDAQYLQATRSGFLDQRVNNGAPGQGPTLPINFDVSAFQAALQDTTPGELGSYFNGGASFNGIVYITATWPGSMDGIPDGLPSLWPQNLQQSDPSQVQSYSADSSPLTQTALPFPLCSDSLGYQEGIQRIGFSGPASDGDPSNGFEPWFTIPSCNASFSTTSRPNALRIINADDISASKLPQGLTIATNLPVYVLGNTNTTSITSSEDAIPWVPFLVAADAISILSSNWNDRYAPWDNSVSYSYRSAASSTYNMAFLSGIVETVDSSQYSGGIENYPRFLEKWSGKSASIRGSFVLGFASVYHRQPWKYGSPIYDAPVRDWAYDKHLMTLDNQPPGAPFFSVHSVSRVNRL